MSPDWQIVPPAFRLPAIAHDDSSLAVSTPSFRASTIGQVGSARSTSRPGTLAAATAVLPPGYPLQILPAAATARSGLDLDCCLRQAARPARCTSAARAPLEATCRLPGDMQQQGDMQPETEVQATFSVQAQPLTFRVLPF